MPSGFQNWSTTAASNGAADSAINWAEGQPPSSVNDAARAMMAVLAKYRDDTAGTLTTGGTSTAYTLTTNTVFTTLALLSGQKLKIKFNATNGASATLNVDGLGAKALQLYSATVVPAGMIVANTIWDVTYDNSIPAFILQATPGIAILPAGIEVPFAGITPPDGWYLEYGQAVSRSTDATLFAAITATCTGDTHANTTIDNLSTDLRNLGLEGSYIEGTGISSGTTIVSIASATSMTVSAAVSGSNTGLTLRILPHGQGDASTTFNIPDCRGRTIAGRDNMGGTSADRLTGVTGGVNGDKLNATGGEETHTLSIAEMPAHDHSGATGNPTTSPISGGIHNYAQAQVSGAAISLASIAGQTLPNHVHTISSQGGGGAHNVVQPTGIRNIIIKR